MQKSTKTPGPAIRIQVSLKLLRGAFRVELLYAYNTRRAFRRKKQKHEKQVTNALAS